MVPGMNDMNLGRKLLSTMAAGDRLVAQGDASGCEMSSAAMEKYLEVLPRLDKQQKLQLANEAKRNHPVLFEDISGHCVKHMDEPWRIERGP